MKTFRMGPQLWGLIGIWTLSAACVTTPDMPHLDAVDPSALWDPQGLPLPVGISGAHFYEAPQVSFDEPKHPAPGRFRLFLGETELRAVTWLSPRRLLARIPASLLPGRYALRLIDPRGREASLAGAFTLGEVHDGGADASLDAERDADGFGPDGLVVEGWGDDRVMEASSDGGRDLGSESRWDGLRDGSIHEASDALYDAPSETSLDLLIDAARDARRDRGADTRGHEASGGEATPGDLATHDLVGTDAGPSGTVQTLWSDPFGDGTPFAFVFGYRGKIYIGPRKDGYGALSAKPDGSQARRVDFSLPNDAIGPNKNRNSAAPPYPSLGAESCAKNSLACGPDNENGRGLFAAGTFAHAPWLLLAGARRQGDLDYVYMSTDVGSVLGFRDLDMSRMLRAASLTIASVAMTTSRLYLTTVVDVGRKAQLLALTVTPPPSGLDATSGEVLDLAAQAIPEIAGQRMNDTVVFFNDRLYLFNAGGCARATVALPQAADLHPGDWAACTPSASAYTSETSTSSSLRSDLWPRDKAFPSAAVYRGQLYVARNTTTGPQLWACDPASSGAPGACDPADWELVAPGFMTDKTHTTFGNSSNTHLTLLVATPGHLYLGFDNAKSGVTLFRSTAGAPRDRWDFRGKGDCNAAGYPLFGCAGLGGNGLVSPKVTQVASSVALAFGGRDYVYLVAGDGTTAVWVLRVAD